MSHDFLSPDAAQQEGAAAPLARSPIERAARAAGARFAVRDGWNVAVGFSSPEQEAATCSENVGWADVCHLGKIEVQAGRDELAAIVARVAGAELSLGRATRAQDAWWLPLTAERIIVVCAPGALGELPRRHAVLVRAIAEELPQPGRARVRPFAQHHRPPPALRATRRDAGQQIANAVRAERLEPHAIRDEQRKVVGTGLERDVAARLASEPAMHYRSDELEIEQVGIEEAGHL